MIHPAQEGFSGRAMLLYEKMHALVRLETEFSFIAYGALCILADDPTNKPVRIREKPKARPSSPDKFPSGFFFSGITNLRIRLQRSRIAEDRADQRCTWRESDRKKICRFSLL